MIKSLLILVTCVTFSCATINGISPKVGHIWAKEQKVIKTLDFTYSSRFLLDQSNLEYVWINKENDIIYRKSCYIEKDEILNELTAEGIAVETLSISPIKNKYIKDFLELFGVSNAFEMKANEFTVYGQSRQDLWRVTWEIDKYEHTIIDSVFEKEILEDSTLVQISLKDNLLCFNEWRLENDSYTDLPRRLSKELSSRTDFIENKNGALLGIKSLTTWKQGISYIEDLTRVLGQPTLIVGSELPSTYYFWEWNDGIIIITLDTLFLKNRDGYNTASQYVFLSGQAQNDDFILSP